LVAIAVLLVSSLSYAVPVLSTQGQEASVNWILAQQATAPTCSPSGLCPGMVLTAYDVASLQSSGTNGNGQTIVIVDACNDPAIASDLAAFDAQFGLPNPTLKVIYPQTTTSCSKLLQDEWDVEISLDVEWSHVMAPAANIDLLLAKTQSTSNLIGAWTYALSNGLGDQISNSWGGSGACTSSESAALKTANSDRVTILASAGDSEAWGYGTSKSVQNPADCGTVLTVGGTTLTVTSSGGYVGESAWGPACISGTGTGGGYVTGKAEPAYQTSSKINDPDSLLGKPDVAADADPCTGVWVHDSQTYSGWPAAWGVVGGTSLSCPMWAGFLADVNQIRSSSSLSPAGTLQPYLYKVVYGVSGTGKDYAKDFHDVTTGSNGLPAGPGWDPDTGLGSFVAYNLAQTLGSAKSA
jgi:subtilase family serine protease